MTAAIPITDNWTGSREARDGRHVRMTAVVGGIVSKMRLDARTFFCTLGYTRRSGSDDEAPPAVCAGGVALAAPPRSPGPATGTLTTERGAGAPPLPPLPPLPAALRAAAAGPALFNPGLT